MGHRTIITGILAAAILLAAPARGADVFIRVDKSNQTMTVLVDGQTRFSWPVSTGMAGYATPAGTYTPSRLARVHYSKEWDDAPMPYSIFFTDAGHAIHGSQAVGRLGAPASHGCVRLAPRHASVLFSLVSAEGLENTRIEVAGMEPIGAGFGDASSTRGSYRGVTAFDPLATGIMAGLPDGRRRGDRKPSTP